MEKGMKTKSKISGYMIRSAVYAVALSVAFIAAQFSVSVRLTNGINPPG